MESDWTLSDSEDEELDDGAGTEGGGGCNWLFVLSSENSKRISLTLFFRITDASGDFKKLILTNEKLTFNKKILKTKNM